MGAVMAQNLKAVILSGGRGPTMYNLTEVKNISEDFEDRMKMFFDVAA